MKFPGLPDKSNDVFLVVQHKFGVFVHHLLKFVYDGDVEDK